MLCPLNIPCPTFQSFQEPYTLTGYRPANQPWSYYVGSIFKLHNETINVWTHLLGIFVFLFITIYYGYEVDYWHNRSSWGLLGFGIGCMIYALLSTIAHLFHSKSLQVHYTCFQFDYVGIGLYPQSMGLLLYTCSGTPLFYQMTDPYFIPVNCLLGITACLCCIYAHARHYDDLQKKRLIIVVGSTIQIISLLTPLYFRIYECLQDGPHCHDYNAGHHLAYTVCFFISVFWFVSFWPQRFSPGMFDLFGQGHQIFHVTIVMTSMLQFRAGVTDWMSMDPLLKTWLEKHVQFHQIFGSLLITVFVDCMFILFMRRSVKQMCVKQEKELKLAAHGKTYESTQNGKHKEQ